VQEEKETQDMLPKYAIGEVVSGSNLTHNFKNQTLTAVGYRRGTDEPLLILRCHEVDSPTLLADVDNGEPIDFIVVSHSDTISIPEARAKFGNLWHKKTVAKMMTAEKVSRAA
jgi:hypothetical protein